jgi:cellulase
MAPCHGPCDKINATEVHWFKIEERGLYNGTFVDGVWGMTALHKGEPWTLEIPKTLKPGNYLIRHELIVIHSLPIQYYMECAQLTVTGHGRSLPGPEYLVKFPGAYNMSGMFSFDMIMALAPRGMKSN